MRELRRNRKTSNNIPPAPEVAPVNGHQAAPESPLDVTAAQAEPAPVSAAPQQPEPFPSDPSDALQRQLDQIRQSQELQRQYYERLQRPQTREDLVAAMIQQGGVTEKEANFLLDHPAMLQHQKATERAFKELQNAGLRDDSEEYFSAFEDHFEYELERKKEKAMAKAANEGGVPEFFQPAELPPEQTPENSGSIYSAPVSRETPTGGYREPSPSQVRLNADELAIAKASGLSPIEYAKNKLKLEAQKRAGLIQQ